MAREGRRKHVVGIMAAREDHRDPPPLQLLGHGKDQLAAQVHVQQRAVQRSPVAPAAAPGRVAPPGRPARNRDRRALAPAPWRRTHCPPPSGPGAASLFFLLPSPDAHSGRRCGTFGRMPTPLDPMKQVMRLGVAQVEDIFGRRDLRRRTRRNPARHLGKPRQVAEASLFGSGGVQLALNMPARAARC